MEEEREVSSDDVQVSLTAVSEKINKVMCRLTETKDTKKRLMELLSQTVGVEDILKRQLRTEIEKGTKLKMQLKSMNVEHSECDFNALDASKFLAEFEDDGEKEKYVVIEVSSVPDSAEQSCNQFVNGDTKELHDTNIDGAVQDVCKDESSVAKSPMLTFPNENVQSLNEIDEKPVDAKMQLNKQRHGLYSGYGKMEKYSGSRKKGYMKYRSKMSGSSAGFRHKENNSLNNGLGPRDMPNFLCFMCNQSFPSLIERKKHEREDHQPTDKMSRRPQWRKQKMFGCPICGEAFTMCHDMQRHAREVHYAFDPNMCDECGKTFVNRFNLRSHKKLHSDEKPFECNVCGKRFKTNSQLTKHGYVHSGEKRYKCDECDMWFTHTFQLRIHTTVHTGELPQYVCRDCTYKCHFRGSLVKHMRIHTGEKPYLCSECGKSFADSSAHKTHMLMHSGLRPFDCPNCNKTFRLKGQLKLHQRIHTGDKRYVCNQCGARYMYSKGLRDHMEKHTGLTRYGYTCTECNRKFITASNLEQHKLKHNIIKEEAVPLDFFIEGSF